MKNQKNLGYPLSEQEMKSIKGGACILFIRMWSKMSALWERSQC